MVKIRLKRLGNKHRPFYRIVVMKSDSGRDSAAIEILGNYNPLTNPKTVNLKKELALKWLLEGAQPTETAAYLLKREGVLDEFFALRPSAKAKFKFLDKRTATMSQQSVVETAAPAAEAPAAEAETAAPAAATEATE